MDFLVAFFLAFFLVEVFLEAHPFLLVFFEEPFLLDFLAAGIEIFLLFYII